MRNFITELFSNKVLIAAAFAWFISQFIKVVTASVAGGKLDLTPFLSSGGMPSAHSATVTAAAVATGKYSGWDAPIFGLAVFFALIVMYDAAGVRRAAGKQAVLLNQLVDHINNHRKEKTQEKLKELLGHTPVEVVAGSIIGIIAALVF